VTFCNLRLGQLMPSQRFTDKWLRGLKAPSIMPNDPATPGDDPWCGDANSLEWVMAWMSKKDPPKGKVGLIYMLNGGSDASNTDPFATAPTEGNNWIKTGRHIMIMNATDLMAGYPTDPKPDTSRPYVMWHGTPYAHLMVPVE